MSTNAHTYSDPRKPIYRTLAAICAVLGLVAVFAAPASAKPKVDGKFDVSGVGTNNEITKGPDGNIWVTLDQTNDFAKITPKGKVTEYDAATVNNPVGIAPGPGKTLWVTQSGGVAIFDPSDPEAAEAFTVNDIADPRAIVKGPDGNMWTVSGGNVIRMDAADPTDATSFPVLVAGRDIDAGKDKLWVADFGSQVVRVTTDGVPETFDTGAGSGLQAIAAGPRGQAAYADPTSNPQRVGRVVGNKVKRTKTEGDPFGVAFADDDAYWMPRFASGDMLRLTTGGKVTTPVRFGKTTGPRRVATGPKHTLWVTLDGSEQVAKVSGVK